MLSLQPQFTLLRGFSSNKSWCVVRPNGTPDFLENFSVIAPEAMAISCLNEVSVFCLFIQPVFIKYLFAEHYSRNWEYCFKQDKNLYFPIGDK